MSFSKHEEISLRHRKIFSSRPCSTRASVKRAREGVHVHTVASAQYVPTSANHREGNAGHARVLPKRRHNDAQRVNTAVDHQRAVQLHGVVVQLRRWDPQIYISLMQKQQWQTATWEWNTIYVERCHNRVLPCVTGPRREHLLARDLD